MQWQRLADLAAALDDDPSAERRELRACRGETHPRTAAATADCCLDSTCSPGCCPDCPPDCCPPHHARKIPPPASTPKMALSHTTPPAEPRSFFAVPWPLFAVTSDLTL